MAVFLRTVLVQNRAEAADRTFQEDLPVNPLSVILVTLRGVLVGLDTSPAIQLLYQMVTSLGVQFRGQDIIRGSLADLAVMNALLTGWVPWGTIGEAADDDIVTVTVPICFGRMPYNRQEAFPAVRRGDLRLEMTVDVANADYDNLVLQIETIELLDETPERYLKYTSNATTFGTTGEETVRLPIGNPLLGVLLFGTTVPAGAVRTATWEQLRTKVDNVEAYYARANWDTLHGEVLRRIHGPIDRLHDHVHTATDAAGSETTTAVKEGLTDMLESYSYLDFDPMKDGQFMLETAGRADVTIQRDVGVADAGRFIPVELVQVTGGGA